MSLASEWRNDENVLLFQRVWIVGVFGLRQERTTEAETVKQTSLREQTIDNDVLDNFKQDLDLSLVARSDGAAIPRFRRLFAGVDKEERLAEHVLPLAVNLN